MTGSMLSVTCATPCIARWQSIGSYRCWSTADVRQEAALRDFNGFVRRSESAVISLRQPTPSGRCRLAHDSVALGRRADITPNCSHRRTDNKFEKHLPDGGGNGREQQRVKPHADT